MSLSSNIEDEISLFCFSVLCCREESSQTGKVREFKTMLENKMRSTGMKNVEICWQDERLTTVQAERVMIEADVSRKKRKEVIDKQAATIILQAFLDTCHR